MATLTHYQSGESAVACGMPWSIVGRVSENRSLVTCDDCRKAIIAGTDVRPSVRLHRPPDMEHTSAGVFVFYGTHSDTGGQMEVVPMVSGNVEFTISSDASQRDGLVFNLAHLDRANLIRALLHNFNYSRGRDGYRPGDDDPDWNGDNDG